MKCKIAALLFILPAGAAATASGPAATQPASRPGRSALAVACVSIAAQADVDANAQTIISALERESKEGTRLVVFSECALSSYDPAIIRSLQPDRIEAALRRIGDACRRHDVYAVVGSPYYEAGRRFNGAFVMGSDGRIVKRYAKRHTVEGDLFADGDELAIFRIDGVPATIMICHDERYPEIFRIPVLAGARIGIYISCESREPVQKQDNYRSQIMARAVENQISVIHCNAGRGGVDGGSHGHSRIIDPSGRILAEAGEGAEEAIRAVIRPDQSRNDYARRGADRPSLRAFWREGLRVLAEQNPEFFQPSTAPAMP